MRDGRHEVLEFIHKFKKERGWFPTISLIAKEIGLTRQAVHYHFHNKLKDELKDIPEYQQYYDS